MRHRSLAAILLSVALALLPFTALAAYPERPIRLILPTAAGTSSDTLVRALADALGKEMGVPIVVDNRPGASNIIGTTEIVRAAPDGYTLGYGNIVSLAINRSLLSSVPYNVDKDLTLIANCWRVSNVLVVNNDVPVKSVRELIDYAKKHPDKLAMASGGNGTTGQIIQIGSTDGCRAVACQNFIEAPLCLIHECFKRPQIFIHI